MNEKRLVVIEMNGCLCQASLKSSDDYGYTLYYQQRPYAYDLLRRLFDMRDTTTIILYGKETMGVLNCLYNKYIARDIHATGNSFWPGNILTKDLAEFLLLDTPPSTVLISSDYDFIRKNYIKCHTRYVEPYEHGSLDHVFQQLCTDDIIIPPTSNIRNKIYL